MKALCPLVGLVLGALQVAAQEPRGITVDWIFSDVGERVGQLPATHWNSDGSLLLLDGRRPKAEQTIERVRPETGARALAVNAKAALDSLRPLLPAKDVPEALTWPESLDAAGRRAVYTFADDLFLLDLSSGGFERLTHTTDKEEIPRLSPDGKKLAFGRGNDLFVMDLATKAETRLTRDGTASIRNGTLSWVYWEEVFNHEAAGYWWSDDSASVAFLRTDETSVSTVFFPGFSPAVPNVIQQRYPKAGGTNPSVRLGVVDLASGHTVWVDPSSVPYEYVVEVKWLPDGQHLAFDTMNRAQDRVDIHVMEKATGHVTRVLTETDPAWVYTPDFHFLRDGSLVATSERSGQTHLYRFDAAGKLVNPITSGPWSVRGPQGFQYSPQEASTVDEGQGVVYYTSREAGTSEGQLYRVGLDGKGEERLSREDGVHVVEWSPDRKFYLDRYSNRRTPPSLSLHAADGASRAVLAAPQTELLGAAFRYPEALAIPAADGILLEAQILKPASFDPTHRYPLVIHVYGEPNAPLVENVWGGRDDALFAQCLLREGYLVASVDARSATGANKAAVSSVLRRAGGDVEIGDLTAAARWFKAQPWIDPARVGIWGWSGGGTTTLLAVTRSQEYKAAIAVAPVTDRAFYDSKYVEAFMKTPETNADGYEYVSLVKRAKDLHGKLLLVFGTYDDNVHPQNSLAFVDELIKAGKPVDMMVYPMRKHDIGDRPARRHLFTKMLEYWKLNL
jgi:dipeptidyl-peptidase-4